LGEMDTTLIVAISVGVILIIIAIAVCRHCVRKCNRDDALNDATTQRPGDIEAVNQVRQQLHTAQQTFFKLKKGWADSDFKVTDMSDILMFTVCRENSMSWKILSADHNLASIVNMDITKGKSHQIYQAGQLVGDLHMHSHAGNGLDNNIYTFQLCNGEIWHVKGRFSEREYDFRKLDPDGIPMAYVTSPVSLGKYYRLEVVLGNDALLILACVFAIHSSRAEQKSRQ